MSALPTPISWLISVCAGETEGVVCPAVAGVLGAKRLAGGGTKHPLAGGRDCLTRLRVVNRHTCCLGTTNQTLVGQLRAPACRNKRVLPRFRCIMRPRRRGAREIGDSFQRRAWQSRNRTARSVWSASSLLALSEGGGGSKREQAPRTPNASRGSSSTAILAACEQCGLLREGGPRSFLPASSLGAGPGWKHRARARSRCPAAQQSSEPGLLEVMVAGKSLLDALA
jgi:hypothetical protein